MNLFKVISENIILKLLTVYPQYGVFDVISIHARVIAHGGQARSDRALQELLGDSKPENQ